MTEIDTAEIRALWSEPLNQAMGGRTVVALCDEIDRLRLALRMQIEGNAEQVAGARAEALENSPERLTIIARSIGRTLGYDNHMERAKDVLRSLRECDLTVPQPSKVKP